MDSFLSPMSTTKSSSRVTGTRVATGMGTGIGTGDIDGVVVVRIKGIRGRRAIDGMDDGGAKKGGGKNGARTGMIVGVVKGIGKAARVDGTAVEAGTF